MKRFHFSLQAVRAWRERLERGAMEKFAQSARLALEAQRRLDAMDAEIEQNRSAWRQGMATGCAAVEILHRQQHGAFLEGRRVARLRERDEAERQSRRAQADMMTARQKRELVDKLRDRLQTRHDIEAARVAQCELDDLAAARHLARGNALDLVDSSYLS
jgi:flagellar export protein FliJ